MAMTKGQKPRTVSWKTALLRAQLVEAGVVGDKLDAAVAGVNGVGSVATCDCATYSYTHLSGLGKCRGRIRGRIRAGHNIGTWAKRVEALGAEVETLKSRLAALESALGVSSRVLLGGEGHSA